MNKIFFLLIIIFQIGSCSLHSSQYDFLKSQLIKKNDTKKPQKNWSLYWINKKIDLYAINFEDKIIFADEEINIFYKDNQIYKITGLLSQDIDIEMDSNQKFLKYILDGDIIRIDTCEAGKMISIDTFNQQYIRSCYEKLSKDIYDNHVNYNSDGMIIGMRFRIHPDFQAIQLSMK